MSGQLRPNDGQEEAPWPQNEQGPPPPYSTNYEHVTQTGLDSRGEERGLSLIGRGNNHMSEEVRGVGDTVCPSLGGRPRHREATAESYGVRIVPLEPAFFMNVRSCASPPPRPCLALCVTSGIDLWTRDGPPGR